MAEIQLDAQKAGLDSISGDEMKKEYAVLPYEDTVAARIAGAVFIELCHHSQLGVSSLDGSGILFLYYNWNLSDF